MPSAIARRHHKVHNQVHLLLSTVDYSQPAVPLSISIEPHLWLSYTACRRDGSQAPFSLSRSPAIYFQLGQPPLSLLPVATVCNCLDTGVGLRLSWRGEPEKNQGNQRQGLKQLRLEGQKKSNITPDNAPKGCRPSSIKHNTLIISGLFPSFQVGPLFQWVSPLN